MRLLLFATLALCVLGTCRCAGPRPGAPQAATCQRVEPDWGPKGTVAVKAETVASGLDVPWSVAFLPDGDLLVTERPGRVRRIHDGELLSAPLLSVPASNAGGESGLLGLAVDPAFKSSRIIFLYRTLTENGTSTNRVERWKLSEDLASAELDKVMLAGIPAAMFHDGGRLRFGPDGMLYVGTGDARTPDSAQDTASLSGKILRLTVDGMVADGNPIVGNPAWVWGLRNTQGFDWLDERTMVVTDHGPSGDLGRSGQDELNVARAGMNFGWPMVSGCDEQADAVPPLMTFTKASPPGGTAVSHGDLIPEWKGSVLVGTLGSKHLHRYVLSADKTKVESHETYFLGEPSEGGLGRLRDVVIGPDGAPYVTTSNCDGRGECPVEKDRIVRIVPASE